MHPDIRALHDEVNKAFQATFGTEPMAPPLVMDLTAPAVKTDTRPEGWVVTPVPYCGYHLPAIFGADLTPAQQVVVNRLLVGDRDTAKKFADETLAGLQDRRLAAEYAELIKEEGGRDSPTVVLATFFSAYLTRLRLTPMVAECEEAFAREAARVAEARAEHEALKKQAALEAAARVEEARGQDPALNAFVAHMEAAASLVKTETDVVEATNRKLDKPWTFEPAGPSLWVRFVSWWKGKPRA